jgi:dephospho-CoA kinase
MNIIGVSGRDRSGKDTVADILIAHGYFGYSFGDAVRKHSLERHKDEPDPISVKNMTETSNWLRAQHGADVILKEALEEYDKAQQSGEEFKGVVLYSVRAPIEADFILKHGGTLAWVESSDQVRYDRKITNMREGEAKVTIDEMLAQESLQTEPQPGLLREVQMDLNYVKSKANLVIENNGSDRAAFEQTVKKSLDLV